MAFNVLVDRAFAADEGQLAIFVHQIEDRATGDEPLVEPLAPIPQPDRIKMRVWNQVERQHESC